MSTVAEIIEAVKQLNEEDKGVLLEKLAEVDFDDAWDRQIEADVKAGRLDSFSTSFNTGRRSRGRAD